MKKLMLFLALTASVWSSFSYAQAVNKYSNFRVEQYGSTRAQYKVEPTAITTDTTNDQAALRYVQESVSITHKTTGVTCTFPDPNGWNILCPGDGAGLFLVYYKTTVEEPPTKTCKMFEGDGIGQFHSSDQPYCANFGETTGGSNPQPLYCETTCNQGGGFCFEYPAGYLHLLSANSCSAPTGPDGGTEPEPCTEDCDPEPCTENCEPTDPETPPGGDDGSGIPDSGGGATGGNSNVGGTITDSDGKVTNIDLTIEQDFTPVTERLNETNKRLAAENKNSSTIIDRLNVLIHGTSENSEKLDCFKDAIACIERGGDMSGVEGKLDGIQESIDAIKDGFGTAGDGESAADSVNLPNYEEASDKAYNKVMETINTGEGQAYADRITNIGDELTAFESIPQLFDLAQDSCAPIPLGKHSLNLCPYAPTISTVLTWIAYMLTLIFLVRSVHAQLQNVRLT